MRRFFSQVFLLAALLTAATAVQAADEKISPDDLQFFEAKIRPVLAENCYKCHSQGAEKVKGGLLLDSREASLKGGNTGPAVVPGDVEKSLIIQAVRYQDKDLQMPPNDRKLPDSQIADLEQWIRMGAPDPRKPTDAPHDYKLDLAKAKKHWAFQPIQKPSTPTVSDPQNWAKTTVDRFILAKLQEKGLSPAAPADKVTLIRRASFDLTGLPPTLKEVDEFLADTSDKAYEKVVDRLLASQRYGERWGRYWLDLCHYADTKGQVNNGKDNRYLYSYTFRDYVIRSLNEDKPYDRFLMEQIAADKLNLGEDKRPLAALGYLTCGNRFNNSVNDIIDDRIDLVCKSTMAMTVNCARCHDHKFDPISTQDYYALHGVFNSTVEPREGPLLEPIKESATYFDFKRQVTAAEAALEQFKAETGRQLSLERIGKAGDYLLALYEFERKTNNIAKNGFMQRKGLSTQVANAWEAVLRQARKKHNPTMAPWIAFSQLEPSEFATKGKELAAKFYEDSDKAKPINLAIARAFSTPPSSLAQVAARYDNVFSEMEKRWQATMVSYEAQKKSSSTPPPAPTLPDAPYEEIRTLLYVKNNQFALDERRLNDLINRDNKLRNKLNTYEKAINDLKIAHPGSPARAQVLEDADKPRDSYVFLRGNPGSKGPQVPRRFIEVLATTDKPELFKIGSGRLELAKAIASPDNPLTARVAANRIWLHHFGEGLVKTPDDFGTRSEPPTNPELLNFLAAQLIEDGWSMKKLHRLLMLSSVYQESSDENPRQAQIDPNNSYFWQASRRRLDFEALRDTILFIGGKLDTTMYGPAVRLNSEPYSTRRSVYGYIDRANLPNMFLSFDFANPDLTTGKRDNTIVPQQALFMMNSALVVEQGRDVVRRGDFKALSRDEDKLALLYRLIYQRKPTDMETRLAMNFIHSETSTSGGDSGLVGESAWEYGYGHFDAASKRVKDFNRMTVFDGKAWQLPRDPKKPKLGTIRLNADGGLTSDGISAVRRWTAPRDGVITIDGELANNTKNGAGVMGRIVASQSGPIAVYTAAKGKVLTKVTHLVVRRGETVDFLVECRALAPKGEPFAWSPVIRMGDVKGSHEWDAKKEFSDAAAPKRLGGWEKFAQVLLETNELTFYN